MTVRCVAVTADAPNIPSPFFRSISASIPTSTAPSLVFLAVDQFGEGSALRVAPELADPLGAVEVREAQDVAEFGAGSRPERVETLAEGLLHLLEVMR